MKDNVNHPSHYAEGRKYEPIKVINDWDLDFNLGNTVKYISRAGRKGDKLEDLEKALFYLKEAINNEKELISKETEPAFKVGDKIKYLTNGGLHYYGVIRSVNEDSYIIEITSKVFYKIELPDYVKVLFDDDDAHIEKVED